MKKLLSLMMSFIMLISLVSMSSVVKAESRTLTVGTDENNRETATMTDDFIPRGLIYDLFSPFKAWLPYWVKQHDSFNELVNIINKETEKNKNKQS